MMLFPPLSGPWVQNLREIRRVIPSFVLLALSFRAVCDPAGVPFHGSAFPRKNMGMTSCFERRSCFTDIGIFLA